MANEQQNVPPPAPPAGATPAIAGKAAGKSKLPVILGVVLALFLVRWMFSGSSNTMGSGASASAGSAAAEDAPASGGNPLLGKWSLANPDDASYCATTEEFTSTTSKQMQNGKLFEMKPIYAIAPGGQRVTVGYGTSYIGNYTVEGPDDITEGKVGPPPYGIASFCKYHRQ